MNRSEAIETLKKAIAQVEWDYPMEIAAALDFAIADMKICEANNAGWISVKDRLPEKGGTYLCYQSFAANPCKVNTYRWSEKNECFMGHEVGSKIDGVTFWTPLPEPPKEGSTDETHA